MIQVTADNLEMMKCVHLKQLQLENLCFCKLHLINYYYPLANQSSRSLHPCPSIFHIICIVKTLKELCKTY